MLNGARLPGATKTRLRASKLYAGIAQIGHVVQNLLLNPNILTFTPKINPEILTALRTFLAHIRSTLTNSNIMMLIHVIDCSLP